MTPEQFAEILQNVQHDNWTFTLQDGDNMHVSAYMKDNFSDKNDTFTFGFYVPFDQLTTEDEAVSWVMAKVEKVVLHEAQEEFQYKGKRVFNPHRDRPTTLWADTSRLGTLPYMKG